MKRRWLILFVLAIPSAAVAAPTSQPATKQSTDNLPLPQQKQIEQQEYTQTLAGLHNLGEKNLADLFELAFDNGDLIVKPTLGPTDRSRVQVHGMTGPAAIAIGGDNAAANGADAATYLNFEHRDFSHPDEVYRNVQLLATAVSLQLAEDVDSPITGSRNVSLIHSYANKNDPVEPSTRLYVQVFAPITEDVVAKVDLSANSFTELRRKYPLETHQYVAPILRHLHRESLLAPDAQLATQVFGPEVRPDERLVQKVNAALAKFDSSNFKERQQAAKDLAAVGQPAAMMLARADRTGWSVDRANGVDAFLEQSHAMPQADASELRNSPEFLLDCLSSDDANIRKQAAAALEKLAGHQLGIDPSADPATQANKIDRLYTQLVRPATTQSTATQP